MFPCITMHVVNAYVDHLCNRGDDTNRPKENLPPPLPIPYPKYII